jgi:hypothetical protein
MVWMPTIAPQAFVEFKPWMAAKVPQRLEAKRRREQRQAGTTQTLPDQDLLMFGSL